MPPYPGLRHSMEVNTNIREDTHGPGEEGEKENDWAADYQAYLEEQELETEANQKETDNKNAVVEEDEEDWAIQYAKHCEEKEKEFFDSYKTKEM